MSYTLRWNVEGGGAVAAGAGSGTHQEELQQAWMGPHARLNACEAAMQLLLRDVEGGTLPQGERPLLTCMEDLLAEIPLDAGEQQGAVAVALCKCDWCWTAMQAT
jgi:hypothetical protein